MKKTMKKLVFAALVAVTLFVLPTRGATSVPYVDEHGANMGSASCTVIASGTKTLSTGWYAVTSNTSNSNRVEVTGSVNLILCDGATLTSYLGIEVPTGKSITIWGQRGGTGRLNVIWPNKWSAGIGGSLRAGFGSITIRGGNISAVGHQGAAGIGGGYDGASGTIDIRGGTITAISTDDFCVGIGGGYKQGCGSITITGGNITAQGGKHAAGIGITSEGAGGSITITGGNITAQGGRYAAGIGARYGEMLGAITISGGTVRTTGGENGAGIGGWNSITISGGTVLATGGKDAAGVGCNASSSCENITISGGVVTATGGEYAAGIGGGYGGSCNGIRISGGTITAGGGTDAPAIGSGLSGNCGNIVIEDSVICVTADGGDHFPYSVGAGVNGTCGTVTICGADADSVISHHWVYNPCTTTIASLAEWNTFASRVNRGVDTYRGKTVTLAANLTVTTMVGTSDHPFMGVFDGNGHTLAVNIRGSERGMAPFSHINGATISNLTVTGTVTSSGHHAAGLVGICNGSCTISGCVVTADVYAQNYAGGIIGHGGSNSLTLTDCVYSGTISGFTLFAGGLLGWCDALTFSIRDCLVTGAFAPVGSGKFHPVACKYDGSSVSATVARTYYLNTISPTTTGSNLIPDANGEPVGQTYVAGEWIRPVTAVDGLFYYRRATEITIGSAAEWNAFAAGVNDGSQNYSDVVVTLADDIAVMAPVGTPDHPFTGTFNGDGHTLTVAISDSSSQGMAPFRVINGATIFHLNVSGSVEGADFASGLVGLCTGNAPNVIRDCAVSVAVSAPDCAGGIVGHGGNGTLAIEGCVFSGTISGFANRAGGILGCCDALTLSISDCIVKGSFFPASSGRHHPIACRNDGAAVSATVVRAYYLNTITPTGQSDILIAGADGIPVSATPVTLEWEPPVTAADGIVYYLRRTWKTVWLTGRTGLVTLEDGDILWGTGGPDTHVIIADGATVTLGGAIITDIPDDAEHNWAGITCLGDATIVLDEGTVSRVKSGNRFFPGIQVGPSGKTLTIRGKGTLYSQSDGTGAGIGSGNGGTCGNIVIKSGNVIASSGTFPGVGTRPFNADEAEAISVAREYGAGIGSGQDGRCGDITITGGDVNAQSLEVGIGSGRGGICGNITIPLGPTTLYVERWSYTPVCCLGAGYGGSCGFIIIGSMVTLNMTGSHYTYAPTDVTYTIRFDANGGTGSMADLGFHWNTPQALTANVFDRTYCAFWGWNTAADGSGRSFADGEVINNIGDTTLYAQWQPFSYTITYVNAADGTDCVRNTNPTTYSGVDGDITLATPIRPGFTFAGWTYEGQDTPIETVVIPHGSTGNRTFTAHWTFCPLVTLTPDMGDVRLYDGHTLTGTAGANTHITIVDGATVTLSGANITGINNKWAGITCLGDAIIILEGDNTVMTVGYMDYSGIQPGPPDTTLTIRGDGSLNVSGAYGASGIGNGYTRGGSLACGDIIISGGVVNATGGTNAAGIGCGCSRLDSSNICGDITITGGTVTACGGACAPGIGSGRSGICGDITISGATVTSIGGEWAAGIGGGLRSTCGTITISGDTIMATGGEGAPGIGTGRYDSSCGDITISDEVTLVVATAGVNSPNSVGVGEHDDSCGTVTIAGAVTGNIVQNSLTYNPAVAGDTYTVSFDANGGEGTMASQLFTANITQNITGCAFTLEHYDCLEWNTSPDGKGTGFPTGQPFFCYRDMKLYAHWTPHPYAITYILNGGVNDEDNPTTYTIRDGDIALVEPLRDGFIFVGWTWEGQDTPILRVTIPSGSTGERTFTAHWEAGSPLVTLTAETGDITLYNGQTLTGTGGADTHVVIAKGATVTLRDANITAFANSHSWAGITCLGDATIVLEGENTVSGAEEYPGIQPGPAGKTLTIQGDGSLDVSANDYGAGIGGGWMISCGNIVIASGTITAKGGDSCAGIGTGNVNSTCGVITITGGTVYAIGGYGSAGIGSGYGTPRVGNAVCEGITITGGNVFASGGDSGAGIGSGYYECSRCGTITIIGGTVNVQGGDCGAGIGSGYYNSICSDIIITGGTVDATGGDCGAGIGSGFVDSICGTITIAGGTVTAEGGVDAEAVGAGYKNSNSVLLDIYGIRVGTVDAENGVTWLNLADRLAVCRNRDGILVCLEPCTSHEMVDGICILCGKDAPLDQLLQGGGTAYAPYLISSAKDWNALAGYLSTGHSADGLCFAQTADISVTSTLGDEGSPFTGCYDGGGHTLTVNYDDTSRSFLAPFPEIRGATIRSLRVEGVASGKIHCSGLVGRAMGGPNTILDCAVSASVSATDGYAGGLIGHGMDAQTTLEGCVFDGSVSASNAGTVWGWSDGGAEATLVNCLDRSDSSAPIGLGDGTIYVTNVGYTNPNKTTGSTSAWSEQNRGSLVYSITPGAGVRLAPVGPAQGYDTAGFAVCGEAILLDGILYAGAGRTVSLTLEYVGSDEFEEFSASAGTLSGSGGNYTLTMPDPVQAVAISAFCRWKYYDPVTGTNMQVPDGVHVYAEGQVELSEGWYVVTRNIAISNRITVTRNVNLVLCDGAALNAMRGIAVAEGARLTIWGQDGEHAVPGTAVTTRGTGTLFAQTYSQAAAIGGENGGSTGDIVVNGGVVTARGVWGAGIGRGNIASGAVGSVTINGGHVDASGNSGSAGIGSGAYADSCPVTISGGYVLATGCVYDATGQATPGIGTGRPRVNGSQPLSNGTITITGGTVVAQAGEAPSGGTAAQAIGVNAVDAAYNGTGHLVLGEVSVYASADAAVPVSVSARGDTCRGTWVKIEVCASHQDGNADTYCDYCGGYCGPVPSIDANGVFLIGSTDDWNVFAASVAAGKRYAGETVQLTANIAVTTTVGTGDHPFGGIFDGGGHTLTVAIDSSNVAAAPFGKIDGATIKNLTVAGTVTSSAYHAAGLVGGCGNDHPNTILNCIVAATVNGSGYAGGIVGHGGEGTLTMDGCVFSGAVSGFNTCAGGLLGWCDALTLTITNCLCTGAFTPAGEGKYHPIACRYASRNVAATVADAYYLNTIVPTVLGVNPTVATSNLIPGAEGTPVSATLVAGVWTQPVTAADGNEYYGWTTAPAGRLIASYTFDDAGNNGANLLHASVGADAIVRATRTTPVAGIGEIAAVTDAAILSGLSAGDGAVSIPKDQHLAVPVPAALLSGNGRPYTIVMKIRVPNTVGWRCLLNMPASNDTDAMVYLQQNTRNIYLKQFNKASNSGIPASNGNVAADQWTTLAFAFGESATDVYRDGTHVMHATGTLAGSYADCAAAGGYILVGADDSGDDDLFYLSDFRIYEGAVAVPEILAGTTSAYDDWAAANGAMGTWDATDASGIHNVFRYLFDKPSGTFENPPLLSISFDASGRAVIHTPPFSPSATGFEISILATDDLAGTGGTTYPLDADGETTIPASDKPARFFRLRVTER